MPDNHPDEVLACHSPLGQLENSSLEDLLAIETRANSSGRKSVTFSDDIVEEVPSPEVLRKSTLCPSHLSTNTKPILKKEDKTAESLRKVLEFAAGRLSRDLQLLVEERDRAVHEIQMTPECYVGASPQTTVYQTRYRSKLEEGKRALDKRIDEVWRKLQELPLDIAQAKFVYSVKDSIYLTVNTWRRPLLRRKSTVFQLQKKERTGLELTSDYARKLEKLRSMLVRGDSEILNTDERSVDEILGRVSRAMETYGRL